MRVCDDGVLRAMNALVLNRFKVHSVKRSAIDEMDATSGCIHRFHVGLLDWRSGRQEVHLIDDASARRRNDTSTLGSARKRVEDDVAERQDVTTTERIIK